MLAALRNRAPKFLLYAATGLVLLIAILWLVGVFGPPFTIWLLLPHATYMNAFRLYTHDVAGTLRTTETRVHVAFAFSVVLGVTLGVLAVLTALRKPKPRVALLATCGLLLAYYIVTTLISFVSGRAGSFEDLSDAIVSILLYLLVLRILTRRSVRDLFSNDHRTAEAAVPHRFS